MGLQHAVYSTGSLCDYDLNEFPHANLLDATRASASSAEPHRTVCPLARQLAVWCEVFEQHSDGDMAHVPSVRQPHRWLVPWAPSQSSATCLRPVQHGVSPVACEMHWPSRTQLPLKQGGCGVVPPVAMPPTTRSTRSGRRPTVIAACLRPRRHGHVVEGDVAHGRLVAATPGLLEGD